MQRRVWKTNKQTKLKIQGPLNQGNRWTHRDCGTQALPASVPDVVLEKEGKVNSSSYP